MSFYTIGEFSRITGLSIKALRLYQERGLLLPSEVDADSGYRYYHHTSVDKARAIARLKALRFSLEEIGDIVGDCSEDGQILAALAQKAKDIARQRGELDRIASSIASVLKTESEAIEMSDESGFEVEERELDELLIAGIRWRGVYSDAGEHFGKLFRSVGMQVCGKPMGLYYDEEFKDSDADCESCVPVRKGRSKGEVDVRSLPGGPALCVMHAGPYEDLGRSYAKLFAYANEHGYTLMRPMREIYRKGPGLIFKGKPRNYLTEIQAPIAPS